MLSLGEPGDEDHQLLCSGTAHLGLPSPLKSHMNQDRGLKSRIFSVVVTPHGGRQQGDESSRFQ